jgi:hypothetical protein
MSQTTAASYGNIEAAEAGAKYDIRPDVVTSRAAEEVIPFGSAVTYGTDKDKQCELVDNAADVFLGVALKLQTIVVPTGGTPQYAVSDTVSILEEGACYVEVTSDVAAGAQAYVDVSNGKFTDVSTSNLIVPGGKFFKGATSGGLAVLTIK